MFRLLARRTYRVHASNPCVGYRSPKPVIVEHYSPKESANQIKNANLLRLVTAYRQHGHKAADLDPLKFHARGAPELAIEQYGLSKASHEKYSTEGILFSHEPGLKEATISQIVDHLNNVYCGAIGVEFDFMDEGERKWFAEAFETAAQSKLSVEEQKNIADLLIKCDTFDNFMQVRYASVKRYGAEGSESLLPFMDELFRSSSKAGVEDVVIGMPHRGRLNTMAILLNYPAAAIFHKLTGKRELPPGSQGVGDVLSHLYQSTDLSVNGKSVHVSLLPNPSHLEAINPVVVGKTRARQDYLDQVKDVEHPVEKSLAVQIHGDAAFAGQGIVAETINMANLPHFYVGGSVHLIVNNQIGFTTQADRGRSSRYSSDIAKIINCPVIHVNGDHPEDVVRACRLAVAYRTKFQKDVLVDLIGFRRRGHNEMDDPTLTQPMMYKQIHSHSGVSKLYSDQLIHRGVLSNEHVAAVKEQFWADLDSQMREAPTYVPSAHMHLQGKWAGLSQATPRKTVTQTGFDVEQLRSVGIQSVSLPITHEVVLHDRLARSHVEPRIQAMQKNEELDWATAEALAFGSLLLEKHNVRICGQDVGRGTFSQRHLMIVDQNSDVAYVPLNYLSSEQGHLEVANSFLSEMAVVGFEYGYSCDNPNNLCIWEAQFGDFFNGAQSMFDTFVTSSETKWLRQTGLVTLLPHGYDGMGPEHSSCRIERWLQLCDGHQKVTDGDNVNLYFAHPTTPAQYFHLLRRQLKQGFRKPLVVASPKTLLRHPNAKSKLEEMGPGTHFHPVLADPSINDPSSVNKVILCSGKFYYELVKARPHDSKTAIIRLEELSPFPTTELKAVLAPYKHVTSMHTFFVSRCPLKGSNFVWVQEEPENQGPWNFVHPRLFFQCNIHPKYVGRPALPTPAVGYGEAHKKQLETVLSDAFKR